MLFAIYGNRDVFAFTNLDLSPDELTCIGYTGGLYAQVLTLPGTRAWAFAAFLYPWQALPRQRIRNAA